MAQMARLRALSGLLLGGERERQTKARWEAFSGQLEVRVGAKQVAVELVRAGTLGKARKPLPACYCQVHMAFLVTFTASGEGGKELGGMKKVGGGSGSGWSRGPLGGWAELRGGYI